MKTYKLSLSLFLLLCLSLGGRVSLHAQEYFSHSVKTIKNADLPAMGNDFWVAIPQNYESQSGNYVQLYVTSDRNTSVNIQIAGGAKKVLPLSAFGTISYTIPLGWEMTTSGIIENKGIHVWSIDAPLSVSFLSRNPYTSDASSVIPTIGWGTEYVVAAYHALYEGFGSFSYDYPSEFTVVAAYDSTICTITPSADIRDDTLNKKILHAKGKPFTIILGRGQSVQYMTTLATNGDGFDLTGTLIRSTKPIGVVGASQCPNIPVDFPYCDHICEMLPPVRSWGMTYYSVPFISRVGGDTYLVIATKDNQTIQRNGTAYCNLHQYEPYFRADVMDSSAWTSDAPFLLAQYINSTTWRDVNGKDNNGIGDPAMTTIAPVEQSQKNVIFQTPTISTGTGFMNYCHIIVRANDKTTMLDGTPIGNAPGLTKIVLPIAQTGQYKGIQFTGYRVSKIKPGRHRVTSDSGATVMVYGYGSYDSYAMNGSPSVKSCCLFDTIAPKVVRREDKCYFSRTFVNDHHDASSHLYEFFLDTLVNLSFAVDSLLMPGVSDSSYFDLQVVDSSQSAFAIVRAFDAGGNAAICTTSYTPSYILSNPSKFSLGNVAVDEKRILYVTLTNRGKNTVTLANLGFLKGTLGFTLDSVSNHPLLSGDSLTMKIVFTAKKTGSFGDTLVFSANCISGMIPFFAGIEPASMSSAGVDFHCIDTGTTKLDSIIVTNSSTYPITIDSLWTDMLNFTFTGIPALPIQIAAGASQWFQVSFSTTSIGNKSTFARFRESNGVIAQASLSGCGQVHVSVHPIEPPTNLSPSSAEYQQAFIQLQSQKLFVLSASPNPITASVTSLRFIYALKERMPITLAIYDEMGHSVRTIASSREHEAGIYEVNADVRDLPSGSYIYRLSSPGMASSGRIVVLK